MPPPANSVEREEERRVNSRTLAIASVASATAAAVTSQLWIAGTWVAAAVTPVLVALISEAMHRPTERIARAWTSEREARASRSISPTRTEPTAVTGTPGPVRVYRAGGGGSRSRPGSTMLTKRRIAVGTVAATAAMACVAGLLLLTTVDLVSGGSVGKGSGRLTLTGGGGDKKSEPQDQQKDTTHQQQRQDSTGQQNNTPSREQTTTEPAPSNQPPSDTTPTTPPTQTSPSAPAPQTETP